MKEHIGQRPEAFYRMMGGQPTLRTDISKESPQLLPAIDRLVEKGALQVDVQEIRGEREIVLFPAVDRQV